MCEVSPGFTALSMQSKVVILVTWPMNHHRVYGLFLLFCLTTLKVIRLTAVFVVYNLRRLADRQRGLSIVIYFTTGKRCKITQF